jgi:hypothetical protein
MSTTVMRDSSIGDDWIKRVCEMNPSQSITDPNTGQPTGNILTGPVRLAFCDLFTPGKPMNANEEGKYGTQALFTPYTDFSAMYNAYYEICGREFADYYDSGTQQYHGLHSPFRDQSEKLKLGGYTPGLVFMTLSSKFKPPIVDLRMNPIVDESRVYPGVWAILSINAYAFGKNPPQPKKGVSFGLQSVMIIADDDSFGGGAPDPKGQFGGVNVQPPQGQPGAMFGQPGGVPASAPGGLPGQAFTTPGQPAASPHNAAIVCPHCHTPNPQGTTMCENCFETIG